MSTPKTIVLTGGNRGLGRATAEKLARAGHRVVLTARDPAQGSRAADEIRAAVPGASVASRTVDLGSFAAIRAFAAALVEEGLAIDVLFHNAGVMQQSPTRRTAADGFEETLTVNALAPFLLTRHLLPALQRAASARVVCVSSRLHLPDSRGAPVDFDFADPQLTRSYDHDRAYKNSKLAVLWVTYELARRLMFRGITANAVCPGFVPATAQASAHGVTRLLLKYVLPHMAFARSVDEASDSLAWMATDPSLDGVTGKFFAEKKELASSPESHDAEKAGRFWRLACTCTGEPDWP